MRVGFGFSNVTFRPSRVFHFRVFSYLGVDTDEQSTGSCPHLYQTFKMLSQIFRADNVFVRFYGLFRYFISSYAYKVVEIYHCTIRFINQISKEVLYETFSIRYHFHKIVHENILLWRRRVSFEYQGLLQNTPASFLLLVVNVKLGCKRHYRNLATYSWWTRHENGAGATPTFGRRRRRRRADQLRSVAAASAKCRRRRRGGGGAQLYRELATKNLTTRYLQEMLESIISDDEVSE